VISSPVAAQELFADILQFMNRTWVESYDPTLDDTSRKLVVVDGVEMCLDTICCNIIDEYAALKEQMIRYGDLFLLVYSIHDRESFEACRGEWDLIKEVEEREIAQSQTGKWHGDRKYDHGPIVLVAHDYVSDSKLALRNFTPRAVSNEEGTALASELGCGYIEACAKTGKNVDDAFFEVVRMGRKQEVETPAAAEKAREAKEAEGLPLVQTKSRSKRIGKCEVS
jgi:GTPase SAR1 family protein